MKPSILLIPFALVVAGCGAKIVTGDQAMGASDSPPQTYGLARTPVSPMADHEIVGTCELIVNGQEPRTCEDVSLFIKNPADGEERRAEMTGAKFKFKGLNKNSYRLDAASSKYDLETNVKNEVTPGQTLRIRILAKPRS